MALISLAIDYKKASLAVRGAFSLEGELLPRYLAGLNAQAGVKQAMILSTCNRTEIYVVLDKLTDLDHVIHWWQMQAKRQDYDLKSYLVVRQESHVAQHMMRLACGLESMVLGEPQILGQLKHAYAASMAAKSLGGELNRLCQKVFSVAKRVRYQTDIGQCPVSVAFSAMTLAKQTLDHFEDKHIVIVGAGTTAALVAKHLSSCAPQKLSIVNRTLEKAQVLAQRENAQAYPLTALDALLSQADIVVTAVNTTSPIITKNMLANRQKHCLLVDLSVPCAVAPQINELTHITAYCVDDIQGVIENNKILRQKAALRAEKWIEKGLNEYINQEKAIVSESMIKAMRSQAKEIVEDELTRSLRRLENGEDPKMVLARFAHGVKNKWLHTPSVSLRNAVVEGRNDILDHAQEIFGLQTGNKK
ncbi:glutamyl-tRNA reductase [Facilibium subflavum]|uniref:glutamyl-tRNA reductase n=1 Tax=Facilibium subflavum TaxID=2219058 RepID=UPI000E648F62|nr:glutamyl-tRNA reductase [Facilibium subflavum]